MQFAFPICQSCGIDLWSIVLLFCSWASWDPHAGIESLQLSTNHWLTVHQICLCVCVVCAWSYLHKSIFIAANNVVGMVCVFCDLFFPAATTCRVIPYYTAIPPELFMSLDPFWPNRNSADNCLGAPSWAISIPQARTGHRGHFFDVRKNGYLKHFFQKKFSSKMPKVILIFDDLHWPTFKTKILKKTKITKIAKLQKFEKNGFKWFSTITKQNQNESKNPQNLSNSSKSALKHLCSFANFCQF